MGITGFVDYGKTQKWFTKVVFISFFITLSVNMAVAEEVNIIFTSDQHYGVTRKEFRGRENVA